MYTQCWFIFTFLTFNAMQTTSNILIIGAGLSGLTLAYEAKKQHFNIHVVEAQNRLGGRIQTIQGEQMTPMELGATWFSDQHPRLLQLITTLGLEKFPQYSEGISFFQTKSFEPAQGFYIPASTQPSYRITGGTQSIIQALAAELPDGTITLNKTIQSITQDQSKKLIATAKDGSIFIADKIFICLPPAAAAAAAIQFIPQLPSAISSILPSVQTWMAGAIKFTVEYQDAFWRKRGQSGMLYSHAGAITEMYDHTNAHSDRFAFTGFLNSGVQHYDIKERRRLVITQLTALFGPEAQHPLSYHDKIWNDTTLQTDQGPLPSPHYNNGHELLQLGYLDNRLYFAGSETASEHPGYMEGAVAAAQRAASLLQA